MTPPARVDLAVGDQLADGRMYLHAVRADRWPSARRCHMVPGVNRSLPGRNRPALCGELAPTEGRAGWVWTGEEVSCSKCSDKAARIAAGRDRGASAERDWRVKAKRPKGRRPQTQGEKITELNREVARLRAELLAERVERQRLEGLVDDLEEDNATLYAVYARADALDAAMRRKTTLNADAKIIARVVGHVMRGPTR